MGIEAQDDHSLRYRRQRRKSGPSRREYPAPALIAWTIDQALATPGINHVIVSTDSKEISSGAQSAGAEVPFLRPDELNGSIIGKFQVWQHALEACEKLISNSSGAFVNLDYTNPLRDGAGISAAIQQFQTSGEQ